MMLIRQNTSRLFIALTHASLLMHFKGIFHICHIQKLINKWKFTETKPIGSDLNPNIPKSTSYQSDMMESNQVTVLLVDSTYCSVWPYHRHVFSNVCVCNNCGHKISKLYLLASCCPDSLTYMSTDVCTRMCALFSTWFCARNKISMFPPSISSFLVFQLISMKNRSY